MNQTDQIAQHLKKEGRITAMQALNYYRCFRLAARIQDLRDRGWQIETELIKVPSGKRVARYSYHSSK